MIQSAITEEKISMKTNKNISSLSYSDLSLSMLSTTRTNVDGVDLPEYVDGVDLAGILWKPHNMFLKIVTRAFIYIYIYIYIFKELVLLILI